MHIFVQTTINQAMAVPPWSLTAMTRPCHISTTATRPTQLQRAVRDYLGSVRAVVDQQGRVEQATDYLACGAAIEPDAAVDRHGHCGKEREPFAGLGWLDNRARLYDPVLMRFTTPDPLAEKYYATSSYAYCLNDPLRLADMNGKEVTLFATDLPGCNDVINFVATHTFIIVRNNNGVRHFAYGSEKEGIMGAVTGKLSEIDYTDDLQVAKNYISGINDPRLKAVIKIIPAEGMTQDELDRKTIEIAESFGNNENITYCFAPLSETQGNCNSSTSTILYKLGVSQDKLLEIKNIIEQNSLGFCYGFGMIKPWTEQEQFDAVQRQQKGDDAGLKSSK